MKIITTVGTSLITNYLNPEKNNNVNKNFKSIFKNKLQNKDFDENSWKSLQNDNYYNKFKTQLLKELKEKDNSCAEKNTLDKIAKNDDEIYLLTTYTIDGYFVGNILSEYYNLKPENLIIIYGLQVHKPDKFKDEGINNLISTIKKIKGDNTDAILNISGGYKALIPILTIIGQLENIPLKYIYEDSEELIEIGKLPINFDFFIAETYHYYLENKEKIKNLAEIERNKLIDLFLITKQNKLTSFGSFFLNYLNNVDFSRDTLGHYYEHKLFYHLFKKETDDDITNDLKGYQVEEIGKKITNGEVDLVLSNSENEKVFIEVKSFGKVGKSVSQFEKYIKYAKEEGITLNKIILFIYKMDFQKLQNHRQSFNNIFKNSEDIEFCIYYAEILISRSEMINYKAVFEKNLEVKKYNI